MPVWFEPVSVPKSTRATALLSQLTYISPNKMELAAMAEAARQHQQQLHEVAVQASSYDLRKLTGSSGSAAASSQGWAHAAAPTATVTGTAEAALHGMLPDIATLLLAGVHHIVLTLGADGAALCTLAPGRQAVTGELGITAVALHVCLLVCDACVDAYCNGFLTCCRPLLL